MKSERNRLGVGGVGVVLSLALVAGRVEARQEPLEVKPEVVQQQPAAKQPEGKGELSSEESLTRFQQLLEKRPFHGPAFEGLVKGAIEKGKLKELVAEYTAKAAALPDDVSLRIILARLHLRSGEAEEAGKILQGIEKLPPDMSRLVSDLLVLKAEVYQKAGDSAAAEKALKQAVEAAGSVSEKLRLGEALADLFLRDGRKDDAVKSLKAMAAEFPDNYPHQRRIAGALAQRGLHEAAVEQYRGVLPLVKDEVDRRCEVLRELGQSLEKLGKRDEAIAAYVEAVGLLGSDHWLQKDLHERIVALYRAGNRLADLAAYCEAQIKRSPEQTGMRILLADVQAAMGKPEDGKKTLADAVDLFPKDLALSQKRVEFLERQGDVEGVAAEFQRAIGQHPGDHELYISYGQSLANSKQIEGARNQWRHVLSTKVDDASLAVRLGALFEAYELYDDAGEAYERAIAANPRQPEAYAALSRLWLSRGDADKAAAALTRMGEANPKDASVQAARSQGLRNLGKVPEALEAITRATELAPQQVKYLEIRSELLVQNGQLEDALLVRRAMIDKMTNPVQQAEAVGTLVSMYASADRLKALKEGEEKRVTEKAGDVVPLLILARAADTERDFPAMRKRLDALLAVDGGNETALTQMAKLQDATGDTNAAVDTYTKLIQGHPARARQFYEAIVDLKMRYSDKAGAIQTLEGMAKGDPANASTQAAVADQLVRMGDQERALPYFEKALQIQQDKHDTRLDYGKALVDAGRLEDGLKQFRMVATQKADMDRAVEAIAKMHDTATQLGKLEDLIDELQLQVETDPSNTLVARALASLLVRELEYGRAMDLLDLVLKHNPRDVDLALSRAEVLRRLARFDEAVEGYQKVVRFAQIDRDFVLGELGKTYFESGQVDQARRLWKQVQNKLYSGSLLKNNGLVEESIAAFEEGIRLKPDEYALHRNLIAAFDAAGKSAEALNAARRLLDLDPGNTLNIEKLAEAYVKRGDRASAAAIAARLFSAGVGADKPGAQANTGKGYQSLAMAMYSAQYAAAGSSYYYGGGASRSNLDRGIEFFTKNGLLAELEEVLTQQVAAQPDNALLKDKAASLLMTQLNKPERAMVLLRELETASYPVEQQSWLGQCSQRDYMRIRQFNLIASKPALRDKELASLEGKKAEELKRDDLLELAIIRSALGAKDKAAELLTRAVGVDSNDTLALGVLTEMLVAAEKFKEAEPHARKLVEVLAAQRQKMQADTIERVRRDFVRSLPIEFQLRVNDTLLADIADKWTLGQGWNWWSDGNTEAVGYLKAKLTLGTILAETGRMDEARAIWKDLAPSHGPDVDRWTMLGDTAQLHKQEDLAFEFYERALGAAKQLAGDPLLQQVYQASTAQRSWYGEQGGIDKAFSSIVEAFSKRSKLPELYDFLRDTDQQSRARKVAAQYKLSDALKPIYERRVAESAEAFRKSPDSRLRASTAYFAQVCKLAELHDHDGKWEDAQKVYEQYLKDFPDELALLSLLGEVAEARLKTEEAIEWEKKVLECKARLAKSAREWALRELDITPGKPQPLGNRIDMWSWQGRWSKTRWGYGQSGGELDRWPSFIRLAQLYLVANNTIAAADAMQRGVAEAGGRRDAIVKQAIELIQQRQLTAKMLPVLRTLAVYAPGDEQVQLAFAESLEAAGQKGLAIEVCNRMLRRGVSDLGVLAEVTRRIKSLSPEAKGSEATLATLEGEVAADAANLKTRLRLAKAYYYSLDLDKSEKVLSALAKEAPHLEDVHDLMVEVYTLRGESEKLIGALKAKIDRLTDDRQKRTTRWRLVDELLAAGKTEEALAVVKDLGDPRDPRSYTRIGTLLNYFGKFDDAIATVEQASKSKGANPWGGRDGGDFGISQLLAARGEYAKAAEKVMGAIDEQSRQQVQYGGVYGLYNNEGSPFAMIEHSFALYPALATEVGKLVEARRQAGPTDPQAIKLAMAFQKSMGRSDKAEELLEQVAEGGAADQALVIQRIDRAMKRHEYDKAIAMAEKFIAETPKPQLPPGMPAQYAGNAFMQSPRTLMLCKLGDVYWDMSEKDKAFETYKQLVDEKVDDTRLAYATICLVRGRADEARKLVDEALAAQQVKTPALLQFRAFIAALDGRVDTAFDTLMLAAAPAGAGEDEEDYRHGGGSPLGTLAMLARQGTLMDKFEPFVKERIAKSPDDWDGYSTLMAAYDDLGRPKDAMALLDQAAGVSTLTQQAIQERMNRRSRIAPVDELIPLYEKLIELSEREVQAAGAQQMRWNRREEVSPGQEYRDQLGSILWDKGEKERAEKLWTERMNAQKAETYLRVGELYLQRHAYDKAEKAFERATELEPDNTTAHAAAAEQAFDRGDRRTLLRHMLECFVRGASGDSEQRGNRNRYYPQNEGESEIKPMNRWAVALASDPELGSYLADPAIADRAWDARTMLASGSGDWGALETLLKEKIDAGTADPLVWKLWAQALQRKGDWAGAGKALDFMRRVKLTTIGGHRERLRLVLAGKQLKEAAAGTRQAQPSGAPGAAAGPQGAMSAYYGGSYGGYDYDGYGASSQLPAIYMKLGDFARAERYYLISSGGDGVEGRLPSLAMLMWEQKGQDRALELMRMALASSGDRYSGGRAMLPQYAAMLSESGKTDAAIDLLIRAYRWDSSSDSQSAYYSMMGYTGGNQQFEQGQEQGVAGSLYAMMLKNGTYEVTVKKLMAESAADPSDSRLTKLVLSLLKQGKKWPELRDALASHRAAKQGDAALTMELFHTECQLGHWDAALVLLDELRKGAPRQKVQWAGMEVFVQLMRDDVEKAVAAAEPLLGSAGDDDEYGQGTGQGGIAALAAAGNHDKLAAYLGQKREHGELDEQGLLLLARVMMVQKRWEPAAALSMEQLWRDEDVLSATSPWWRMFCFACAGLGTGATASPGRVADAALVTLATAGPEQGFKAFAAQAEGPDATLEALRGLLFAATLKGDDAAALKASDRLTAWLAPRRMDGWYRPPTSTIQRQAKKAIEQMGQSGTAQVAMSMGYGAQLAQVGQQMAGQGQLVTYDGLWQAHAKFGQVLLARAGETARLRETAREQARMFTGDENQNEDYRYAYQQLAMRQYGGMSARSMYYNMNEDSGQSATGDDWEPAVRKLLMRSGRFAELSSDCDALGERLSETEMPMREIAAAAIGREQDAAKSRAARARTMLAALRVSDRPTLSEGNQSSWYWYGSYNRGDQDAAALRMALAATSDDGPKDPDVWGRGRGDSQELWEIALVDASIESQLVKCAEEIGPGWGSTRTLSTLVSLYRAQGKPEKVIEVLERAGITQDITRSPNLDGYVWACYRTKAADKLEAVLNEAAKAGPAMENDIAVARMTMLRLTGQGTAADEIEKNLLSRCIAETSNRHRPAPGLRDRPVGGPWEPGFMDDEGQMDRRAARRWNQRGGSIALPEMQTATQLAWALGLQFEAKQSQETLTLTAIRGAYQRHGLHEHIARILDREIAEAASPEQGFKLGLLKAESLRRAGRVDEGRKIAREIESGLLSELAQATSPAEVQWKLAQVYQSPAFGPDYAKALAAISEARRIDPGYDQDRIQTVHCLYELGQFAEAWDAWKAGAREANRRAVREPTAFYASVAASKAGDKEAGKVLAREALYRYPGSPLAKKAREVIDEH